MDRRNGLRGKVAIVGGGPAGLVAAKYLKEQGFEPTVFEQSDGIGGQWNARGSHSGVWPSMPTNTSRVMTCFSDFHHDPDTVVYPSEQEMLGYLQRYAAHFGLMLHIRLRTRVELIERDSSGSGWVVRFVPEEGEPQTEAFPYVIVASGRYNKPMTPSVPGLDSFSLPGDVTHTFHYKGPSAIGANACW